MQEFRKKNPQTSSMEERARKAVGILAILVMLFLVAVGLTKCVALFGGSGLPKGDAELASLSPSRGNTSSTQGGVRTGDGGGIYGSSSIVTRGKDLAPKELAEMILAGESSNFVGKLIGAGVTTSPPAAFAQGIIDLRGTDEVYADESAQVVSFTRCGSASEVFSSLSSELLAAGWSLSGGGWEQGGTFYKQGGEYSWLMVMCYQMGEAVSVVMQYR